MRLLAASAIVSRLAAAEPAKEYVQLGGQLGDEQTQGFVAARLDVGYRVSEPLWLHAGAGLGAPIAFSLGGDLGDKDYVSGSLREIGLGIEARRCATASMCGAVGVDVGYKSVTYADMDSTNPSQSVSFQHRSIVAMPRLQLELGGGPVRVRPTLEIPIGSGVTAVEVVLAVALQI